MQGVFKRLECVGTITSLDCEIIVSVVVGKGKKTWSADNENNKVENVLEKENQIERQIDEHRQLCKSIVSVFTVITVQS